MKDILETILRYIPGFIDEFIAVLSSPKNFVGKRNREDLDRNFINSLAFLGISLSLAFFLQSPLMDKDDFFPKFVSAIVRLLLVVILCSVVLRISWKIVGGKAPLKSFMITYSYYSGVTLVIYLLFSLAADGIVKQLSPELFEVLLSKDPVAIVASAPFSDKWYVVGFSVKMLGVLAIWIWLFLGWGAYRQLNELSKKLSIFALFLTGLFSWPVFILIHFLKQATA